MDLFLLIDKESEDIERIRRERNRFVHKVDANISEAEYDKFFITFIGVGKRLDAHLKKNINNGYAHAVEQCKTCVLDPEVEKKLLDARADVEQLKKMYSFGLEKQENEVHVYVAKSTEAAIAKIDEVDNSEEVVKYINSLKEDLNSDNINFKGAEIGSIILFIDVKKRVVLDDDLFQSNIRTFIRKCFKLCSLKCYLHTHTNAVIASAAEEFEESTINPPEKAGSCLLGEKGHVVVSFEVKNKVFHSADSFNRTLNEIFRTLVKKDIGQNFLGTTDVYAELAISGNTTTTDKSCTQAQIPVKTNLPVSFTLRQQSTIKKSKNENTYIMSCIKIGDALVFTEDDSELIICNPDGTDIHHMHLSYRPSFLADVDVNTVAVGCAFHEAILIINISTRSVTSTINTSGKCTGISYIDNNLYVNVDGFKIHVMDLTGKVKRSIPLPLHFSYDLAVERDRFVCLNSHFIHCYSLDGKLIWNFKADQGQDFRRVTIDNKGNVYVTDCGKNTVFVVSDDGKQYRVFLSESDGLNKPWGIYFEKKENILLVSNNNDGKAFLFDVKKTK
ncbi:Hypothetical predicted protein [Mytilus galloprovincialis]|uniref:Uncharacterized protein n=1 Tax=Mytilus galloprovincialis TaxID=29158 RepID=A0A8B6CHA2_MYTGA|nr:Hypothetical predicted protein [Mytilus galloprovincialis]